MSAEFASEEQGDQSQHRSERPREVKFARPQPAVFTSLDEEAAYRKDRLVLACRILAREGYEFCGTYISERDPVQPAIIWTHPADITLSAVTVEDLVQLDLDGNVLTPGARGSNLDINAISLHLAIYAAPGRSDMTAICHSHSPHARAFAMGGNRELRMISQDAALFYNAWTSIPLRTTLDAASDPKGVQQALGSAKVAILAGRGALAVHSTIEGCVGYFLRLDGLCYVQMLAEAAEKGRGQPMVYVSKEAAEVTVRSVSGPHHAWLLAKPNFVREERFMAQERASSSGAPAITG
ncbi:hypothetical protein EHS25_001643 [Saitozyma podzolica]|uniref:Class II aldolase/adducin N-terminal domain-containing protein n=1 Tax=Saitozyma podzolica TaxID=1890683 RepID=A0A427YGN0_9TREE|nr:hypothetical protein EHS25_001643 [Saitozyma podzolica]